MATGLLLLLTSLASLAALAAASHHFGGTVSFTYKGTNADGTFQVAIRNRATYDGCQYNHYWSCYTGNCGNVSSSQKSTIDGSTNVTSYNSQWCETETVETRAVSTNTPFQMRSASCCWIPTRNSVGSWRLNTLVDLGVRSDTGKPNSSPDIAILPFLRVPKNCPRTYKLMSYDPDGDRVRCRYGNIRNLECINCNLPQGFHLDQDSCTLHYRNASDNPRVFAFEMVVEDYPRGHMDLSYSDGSRTHKHPLLSRRKRSLLHQQLTTTSPTPSSSAPYVNSPPLSKLPLQFSLLVDPAAPSCQEGVYLPRFVSPTPENGEHIQAEVNKETEIRIKAVATHSVLQNIIISGPTNVSKSRNTHDEFVIRWTPTVDDLGDHYPVCFAVESSTGSYQGGSYSRFHRHPTLTSQSGIYQSEMRCVVLDIRNKQIEARVTCGDASMTVEVEKSSFSGIQASQLRLSDASNTACNLAARSNSTHIIATVPLNSCGTQIEEDDDYIIFKNEISTGEDVGQLVTRHHLLEARFYCRYPRRGNASLGYTAHRRNVTVWEKGLGTFTYQLEFYQDPAFRSLIRPDSYPLEYELGSRIYLQLDASSSLNNTVMMVDSCRAAPYDNPSYRPSYSIIQNGCAVDPTVQIYSNPPNRTYSPPHQFQFSMEAFKFIGMHDQVYISCSVIMCEAGNPNTRCSQGCLNASWPQAHRHRREAPIQSAAHFVSQGPLRLKRSAEAYGAPGAPGLNMNLVLVAGCLLAAVAMICGVIVFKARMSKVRYQPLPSSED